jgi:maleate isomerase
MRGDEKNMSQRKILGMLTPSSNTSLEPLCAAMLADVAGVSVHFSRFRVTQISLSSAALSQFDIEPMLQAASLLADARVNAICWNGTSAGWLGFDQDRALCRAIQVATGIGASSSVLALEEIFRHKAVKRFGLVSPYLHDVQERVVATFAGEGFDCIAERHLGISENFAFSEVPATVLTDMVRAVAADRPEAIMIFCTNLRSAQLVQQLEQETGIPIYDTTAAAIWSSLRLAGVAPSVVRGWGRLFRELP